MKSRTLDERVLLFICLSCSRMALTWSPCSRRPTRRPPPAGGGRLCLRTGPNRAMPDAAFGYCRFRHGASSSLFDFWLNICNNVQMDGFIGIGAAAKALGVSISTLRRWEREGRIQAEYTKGGHRRYNLSGLVPEQSFRVPDDRKTIAYARVSSSDQKDDLERQKKVLEVYCAQNGWTFTILSDLGSGMNYHKKGLRRLLSAILNGHVGRLVITHKDRLLRFGAELVFAICEAKNVEVVILNQREDTTFEEDLARDVLEIITVFSARLYGSRSRKNQKLLESVKKAVEESAEC